MAHTYKMASGKLYGQLSFDPVYVVLQRLTKACESMDCNNEIRQGVQLAMRLCEDRLQYCEKVSTGPSEALNAIARQTSTFPFDKAFEEGKTKTKLQPIMISGCLEGKFLQSIVLMNRAKHVLEIGMFTGYATLACAEVLPDDGEIITCEFDPFLGDFARELFDKSPHGNKIDIRIGDAQDTLHNLAEHNRRFDVIFVDANKDGYLEYYKTIMNDGLLAEDGIILFDNCLFHGLPYCMEDKPGTHGEIKLSDLLNASLQTNNQAIKELNDFVMTQDEVFRVLLPIRDGVLVILRKPKHMHK